MIKLTALICLVSGSLFAAGITPGGGGGISYPPGSGGGSLSPTTNTTNTILGIATNVPNMFVTQQLTVGNPATGVKITGANGVGSGNGMPFILWNSYVDYNTNQVLMTNNSGATFNQAYVWLSTSNLYVGIGSTVRYISNRVDFSLTNVFGPTGTNYWATLVSLGTAGSQFTTNFPFGTWYTAAGPTNTRSWFPTNAAWTFQTFGSVTNFNGATNGISALGTSNGIAFSLTSTVGSTNQQFTILGPPNPLTAQIPIMTNTITGITLFITNGLIMKAQ